MSETAVQVLIHEYAWRLDRGDLDGVAALFVGADWHSPDGHVRRGRQIREMYDPVILYADGTPRTQHVITNVVVELDGDRATSRAAFTVLQATDGFPLQAILAGRYHDRFERAGGEWRFVERTVHPDFLGDLSHHMQRLRPGFR